MKNCEQCQSSFEVSDEDRRFYEKVSPIFNGQKYLIPEPTLCPDCRQQRRLTWRNERYLYKRQCNLCQKKIISMYRSDVKVPVYCLDCWWSDDWNAYEYGQDFDFNRPFFEQLGDLQEKVAHFPLAVLASTMENSDYCNHAGYLKNCYLIYNSDKSEQCFYGKGINRCFDCVDCFKIYDCEACYEASNCNNCKFCTYLIDSQNCNDCHFSSNLIGCKHCFGSTNLRNKEYYFFNQKLSPEEYKRKVDEMMRQKTHQEIWGEFKHFRSIQIMRWMQEKKTENCTGDYLVECKNCEACFDCEYLEDSKYCSDLKKGDKVSFNNQDVSYFGVGVDSCYETGVAGYNANHLLFCENVWDAHEALYSLMCSGNSHNIFGCVGLKHGSYSILNKQYTKEEYDELASKIIHHMQQTGEWGQFPPATLSPFSYNETTANEYYPLSQQEVEKRGLKWLQEEVSNYSDVSKKIPAQQLPNDIRDIPDDILNWAIECQKTGKLFRIQKLELAFYRKMNLPIPKFHPDVRHEERFKMRSPRKLSKRECGQCQKVIETTYSFNQLEKVYCEECYLREVY